MKPLHIIVAVAIAIPLAFFGVGAMLPTQVSVERSINIEASPGAVFSLVGDLAEFDQWDPWTELDPDMEVRFSGPEYGVGATRSWSGNSEVGSGSMTIVEFQPNRRVKTSLDFGDHGRGEAEHILTETNDGGTQLRWTFHTSLESIPQRYFGLIMDVVLGPQYEKGLAKLKAVAEQLPPLKTRELHYTIDDDSFTAYLAYPIGAVDPLPAVVVVHEWWGHNAYARKRAEQLAELGYVALALDMYGSGKVAEHPQDAMTFMQEVGARTPLAVERFDAATSLLEEHHLVDPTKIAAIGYCFGGSVVMNMARLGKNLRGAVSFHGGLGDLAPIAEHAHTPVLVLNGAADPMVTEAHKTQFRAEMEAAGLAFEVVDYADAVHAFTNPAATAIGEKFSLPLAYNAEADAASWQKMQDFLARVFTTP